MDALLSAKTSNPASLRPAPLPPPSKFFGATVSITIIEAAGLIAMDKSMLNSKGKSDPYVQLQAAVNDGAKISTTVFDKTKHKKGTLSPTWNESFTMELTAHHSPLVHLLLFDKDFGSGDDEMGEVKIDLFELKDGIQHKAWHNVKPSKVSPFLLVIFLLLLRPQFQAARRCPKRRP